MLRLTKLRLSSMTTKVVRSSARLCVDVHLERMSTPTYDDFLVDEHEPVWRSAFSLPGSARAT